MAQAQVQYFNFGWVGHGFYPGVEHHWAWGPLSFKEVWQVVCIPLATGGTQELMVKDMRVRSYRGTSGETLHTLLWTVRNTGANPWPPSGYSIKISVVSAL